MRVILVGDAGHLAVKPHGGAAGRRGAHRAQEARRAEPVKQARVGGVLGEIAIRPAVRHRQDPLAPAAVPHFAEPVRDEVERLVPRDRPEGALPLSAGADARMEHARRAVEMLRVSAHLGADVAARDRIAARAADGDDAAVGDRHVQAAGVGAVERAGALEVPDVLADGAHAGAPTIRSTASTANG